MREPIVLTWSGGKDSVLALHYLRNSGQYQIRSLLTTITQDYDRISMHGVRSILLDEQAESLGFPLEKVFISKNSSNEEYETRMKEKLLFYQREGISCVVFGDLFLEDIRNYREQNLAKVAMKGIFPLWQKNTQELARQFIELGFKAVIICIDSQKLDKKFVGRYFDRQLLSDLPATVDPCGENGEFHSFVFDGPIFNRSISFTIGESVLREERFYFCDLLP
ncbi:MAG TPA: ATP-binding protein [Candidatus Atribacteria bacterium]|nr:ATP-binding protein [Candidatus Atribacteria bacterium]